LVQAAMRGWGELFIHGADRRGLLLHRIAAFAHSGTASGLFFEGIAGNLNSLSLPVRSLLVPMLGGMTIPRTVAELCMQCGLARRSLDRAIQRSGFISTKRLLSCIQLASAWTIARSLESATFEHSRTSYESQRTIDTHCRTIIGLRPRAALSTLSDREVANKLTFYATQPVVEFEENAI